jgi:hypothetical protein
MTTTQKAWEIFLNEFRKNKKLKFDGLSDGISQNNGQTHHI